MNECFRNIVYFKKIDSSNDYLINLYKSYSFQDVLTVYVDKQLKGRGRMGKRWISHQDKGLTFSFSIQLQSKLDPFTVNMIITVSIVNFLRSHGMQAFIKYPNDIIINNKKIAGVLVEIISVLEKKYAESITQSLYTTNYHFLNIYVN